MGTESADRQQQKYREFMTLLPLTIAIAGLGECEAGKHFSDGQMEARGTTIKQAYKVARQLIQEVVR